MRKISLTTTQNVTIEYELATISERSISTIIDLVIIYLGTYIIYISANAIFNDLFPGKFKYFVVISSFLYHIMFEYFNSGQTIGKKILKIRVVKINGERPGLFDFVMRTSFRIIDITSTFGSLALFTISSTEKGQRLGDFFADTTVIKLINFDKFSLDTILSMEKLKDYTPKYMNVTYFKEEEMLLIKETIDRCINYPNPNHTKALELLVKKIEEHLGIVAPPNKIQFLNTLIKDYVSLTR